MNILEQIKSSFEKRRETIDLSDIQHIFVSGSIAADRFYDSWSDVDIVIVAKDTLSGAIFGSIREWGDELRELLHCKIGFDYVSTSQLQAVLQESSAQKQAIIDGLHFAKNFHSTNRELLRKGTIYHSLDVDQGTLAPVTFIGLHPSDYVNKLREQVYETLLRAGPSEQDSRASLRIVTKACLYLLQTKLLLMDGTLVTDYRELPRRLKDVVKTDTQILETVYDKLVASSLETDVAIQDKYITQVTSCFNSLIDEPVL